MRERPGRSPGSAVAGRTGGATRVAMVGVLLAVAVAGLRAHGTFSRAAHSAAEGVTGSLLAILLATGEGIAVVAFIIVLAMARPERKKNPDTEPPRPPFPWWAKTLGVLVAVAVMITPFVVLFSKKSKRQVAVLPPLTRGSGAPIGAGRLRRPRPGRGVADHRRDGDRGRRRGRHDRVVPPPAARGPVPRAVPAPGQAPGQPGRRARGPVQQRRSPGRDHRLLRGDGARFRRRGLRAGRRRHARRGPGPGSRRRDHQILLTGGADRPVPPGQVQRGADDQRRLGRGGERAGPDARRPGTQPGTQPGAGR